MLTLGPRTRVRFFVADDEQANHVEVLLDALGYDVEREGDARSRRLLLERSCVALAEGAELTPRETQILAIVVTQGLGNREVAQRLEVELSTIKWHMHNIFTKTNTANREALLRAALGMQARPPS